MARRFTKMTFNHAKVDNFNLKDLEDSILDVIFTTLNLTKACGINSLDIAITQKIKKNNDRG